MFFFIDVFLLIVLTNNIDKFIECSSEFTVVIFVLSDKFVNLLQETLVWRSSECANESAKPSFLPCHEYSCPFLLKGFIPP